MAAPTNKLVLITGAGASTNFGANGRNLPLMAGWSDALVTAFDETEPDLATTLGLHPGLEGQAFEEVLGTFLRWTQTLEATKRFIQVGRPNERSPVPDEVATWLVRARQRITTIVQTINKSLWREFGLNRVDTFAAADTYLELLKALRALPVSTGLETALFSATTNYDRSAEAALTDLEFHVDTGARATRGRTERLDFDAVQPWVDVRRVPHLYLHGAVGWYRDPERGGIRVDPADRPYDDRLTPAVLYPDPEKDPLGDGETGVTALWDKFKEALGSATHVLVLGHSLHDGPLLKALSEATDGQTRLAFTFHGDSAPIEERLSHYGLARPDRPLSLVDMNFQAKHDFRPLRAWIDGGLVRKDGTVGGVPLRNFD